MTINISMAVTHELKPRITVIGCGGAGGNAVDNMITSHLEGVEFVVANTDAQALARALTERRIQLGPSITNGLGAGSRPEVGRMAAEESIGEILDHVQGSHMVFITAGMGGGTGTGSAPVIAKAVREQGILTVGVVSKPFQFEGRHRMRAAEQGLEELQQYVDTLIVIPNQNLFRVANERTSFIEAFKLADNVLHMGVRGVTDLMVMPGLVNLDFADIRTVMSEMGKAMMGTGEADGENRAVEAAEEAISNPLLDEVSMQGARGVLINITGGKDISLHEVDQAVSRIAREVDEQANIIFGSTLDESMEGRMRVSVVATGIDAAPRMDAQPRQEEVQQAARLQPQMPKGAIPFPPRFGARPAPAVGEPRRDEREHFVPAAPVEPAAGGYHDGRMARVAPGSQERQQGFFEKFANSFGRARSSEPEASGYVRPDIQPAPHAQVPVPPQPAHHAPAVPPQQSYRPSAPAAPQGQPERPREHAMAGDDNSYDIPTFLRFR
ncbi:cell division protein FtsZ [Marinivivus vitaminiproducens]|uniref:cell division protein FtsZ n=1 Tax=Marinivivus vitaminiproducens TaxID=3035935 RepID=UPI0027A9F5E9|nr:cell division protein FtsZ [Geminicoccaceae bacterium SCSIO 64248]